MRKTKIKRANLLSNLSVELTSGGLDDQPHILKCTKILEKMSSTELASHKVKYEDIFGEPSKQKEVKALFQKIKF